MLKDGKDDAKFLEQVTYLKGKSWEIKGRQVPGAISIPKTRGSKGYEGSERIKYKGGFQIRHYAAEVIYDVDYWVEKNRDSLQDEQYKAIASSRYLTAKSAKGEKGEGQHVSLLQKFQTDREPGDGKNKKPATLGSNFKNSLFQLVDSTLMTCRCSFVRCIKPNTLKLPKQYDSSLVLNQLQYTGMLDTLIIRKEGWPKRPTHQEFYEHFKPLFPSEADHLGILNRIAAKYPDVVISGKGTASPPPSRVKDIIIFVGKTRVLMKDDFARSLENLRSEMMVVHSLTVQSVYRYSSILGILSIYGNNH